MARGEQRLQHTTTARFHCIANACTQSRVTPRPTLADKTTAQPSNRRGWCSVSSLTYHPNTAIAGCCLHPSSHGLRRFISLASSVDEPCVACSGNTSLFQRIFVIFSPRAADHFVAFPYCHRLCE